MGKNIFLYVSVLIVLLGGAMSVHSAIFNVTTNQDNVEGSLRAAITAANTNGVNDTIYLPAGTYILVGAPDDDANLSGDLDIDTNHRITIIGDGSKKTIIDGNNMDRVLHILKGTVSISGVTICNGKARDGEAVAEDGHDGGGIYNRGVLSLTGCLIDSNSAGNGYDGDTNRWRCSGGGGSGGGIYNSGSLTLTNCSITTNNAGDSGGAIDVCGDTPSGGHGGGIYNRGTGKQVLINCTIKYNKSGCAHDDVRDEDVENNGGEGGGIYNNGVQELKDCRIESNATGSGSLGTNSGTAEGRGGYGGGIYNDEYGFSILEKCIINCNYTGDLSRCISPMRTFYGGHGGGIYNRGAFSLIDCTISSNHTNRDANGGGIFHVDGKLTLTGCTIIYNYTGDRIHSYDENLGHGGGIHSSAPCKLTRCTISSNFTGNGGSGGGLYSSAALELRHCTICRNRTGSGGAGKDNQNGEGGNGGGICVEETFSSVLIFNTIVADNEVPDGSYGPDCYRVDSDIIDKGYNLIENGCSFAFSGSITGVDPMLGELADNGGPTLTHALLPGSPAIDAGNSPANYTDQRGFPRPFDVPGIPNAANGADIGAYELTTSAFISGTITYGGVNMSDVTLSFSNKGGKTYTDDNGNYSHKVSYGWSGAVTPSKAGYTFVPSSRGYYNVTGDHPKQNYEAIPLVPAQLSLNRNRFSFGADTAGFRTDSQVLLIGNSGGGFLNWTAGSDSDWLICSPPTGTGPGAVAVSVDTQGLSTGTYNGVIAVEDPNAVNSPQMAAVTLTVYKAGSGLAPFGSFDTPAHGSTVRSSIPVTGWAIDNIGIESVKIYREPTPGSSGGLIYIGDAALVEGARPDVEALYPDNPWNYKAGWGYMMLTNFLPNQGNGNFTLHAIATDKEGNETELGSKTITCDNANAVKPFGAIDTPAQGGSAHGKAYVNFGWALTPQPNTIPFDGSTINVWVDGVPLGHPVYNQHRPDIAGLFPGYNNSSGAVGYYYLDATPYENGIHTIQWTVADNAGNSDGIGSRYFSIQNTGASRTQETVNINASQVPVDFFQPIRVKKGYANSKPQTVYPGDNGDILIKIKELERLEIHFFDDKNSTVSATAPLPIGSTLDAKQGIFYWQPGPGFMGKHRLVFITRRGDDEMHRKQVTIDIRPE